MAEAKKLVLIGSGLFITICLTFGVVGYSERTETPPLTALVLTNQACEQARSIGIDTDKSNGICTVQVRFRKSRLNNGGTIEKSGIVLWAISSEQVVGYSQIDDGSDEPWSAEHKQAIGLLIGSIALMVFLVLLMAIETTTEKRIEE